jgi:Trypsin-like peptidase domain
VPYHHASLLNVDHFALARHVRIKVTSPQSIAWGSGTIINFGRQGTEILTNKHVVGKGEGVITIDDGTTYWRGVKCREVWPLGTKVPDDLAVIIAEKKPPACAPMCSLGYEPVEPLYAIGIGDSDNNLPSVVKTRILKRWVSPQGESMMKIVGTRASGDSGGGVYDSHGVLIGVMWGGNDEGKWIVDLTRSSAMMPGTRQKSQTRAVSLGMWMNLIYRLCLIMFAAPFMQDSPGQPSKQETNPWRAWADTVEARFKSTREQFARAATIIENMKDTPDLVRGAAKSIDERMASIVAKQTALEAKLDEIKARQNDPPPVNIVGWVLLALMITVVLIELFLAWRQSPQLPATIPPELKHEQGERNINQGVFNG